MKSVLYFILLLSISIFFTQEIYACSCAPLPPIYQAYEDAGAVFIGKVISSNEPEGEDESYDGHDIIFEFEIVESFKGVKGKRIKLNRGTKHSSCYSGYAVGETYLVYASSAGWDFVTKNPEKTEGVVFQGSFCHRTSDIKTAQDQLYFIREMLKGKAEPQVYGSVARSDVDPVSFKYRHTFLEKIKVVIQNEKSRFETLTDKNGLYTFNNVPPGEYVLKPVPGDNYRVYFPGEEKVTVLENKKVSTESYIGFPDPYSSFFGDFTIGWNNRIEGRVVDSEGKPFERYVIAFLPVSRAEEEITPKFVKGSPDHHGEKGEFWFYGETPGKYVIAVEIYAPFGNTIKKRFFYPNAETSANAKVFDISAADKITGIEIKLPFIIRHIKGELFWENGEFINDSAWIRLKRLDTFDDKINTSFDWEGAKNGRFSIQALEGFEYWVHPEMNVEVYENGKEKNIEIFSKPQKVKIGKKDYPLKVVFEKPKNLISQQ